MRKTLLALALGVVAAGMVASAPVRAADVPSYQYYKKAPPPVFDWSGFYIEGNIGYAIGDVDFSGPAAFTVSPKGLTGGIGIGYDALYASNFIIGVVADVNLTGVERLAGVAPAVSVSADLDYFGTVRGKLGYSFGSWNVYGTGGYAWGHLASRLAAPGVGFSADDFVSGWAYGVGAEFALTRHWTVGAEWLRLDFNRAALNYGPGTLNAAANIDLAKAVVRYRF